jgi:hypothetical protein
MWMKWSSSAFKQGAYIDCAQIQTTKSQISSPINSMTWVSIFNQEKCNDFFFFSGVLLIFVDIIFLKKKLKKKPYPIRPFLFNYRPSGFKFSSPF